MIDVNIERITKVGRGVLEITKNGRKEIIEDTSDRIHAAIRYLEKNNRQFIT